MDGDICFSPQLESSKILNIPNVSWKLVELFRSSPSEAVVIEFQARLSLHIDLATLSLPGTGRTRRTYCLLVPGGMVRFHLVDK